MVDITSYPMTKWSTIVFFYKTLTFSILHVVVIIVYVALFQSLQQRHMKKSQSIFSSAYITANITGTLEMSTLLIKE